MNSGPSSSTPVVPEPATTPQASGPTDLDRKVLTGIAWTGGLRWLGQAVAWSSTMVVARILSPADYGIFGVANVTLSLLTMVAEFGIGSAVVSIRELDEEQLAQINGLSVLFGASAFAFGLLLAWPLGLFFGNPAVGAVIGALSAILPISSLRTVPWSLLQKDLRFKRLAILESMQIVIIAVLNVTLASLGFRYWTLVVGAMVASGMSTAFALRYHPHRFAWPKRSTLGEVIPYMRDVVLQRIAWWASSSADMLVAGRMLGSNAAGAYSLAWTLSDTPVQKINEIVLRVAPSMLSAAQHDLQAMRRYLLKCTQTMALIVSPVTVGISLVAPDFVHLVLGPKWMGVVAPLQILSLYASVRCLSPLMPMLINVLREPAFIARLNVVSAIVMATGFYVGSYYGVTGIAMAWVILNPPLLAPLFRKTFRMLDMNWREYLAAVSPAISGCVAMALVVVGLGAIPAISSSAALSLPVRVIGGTITYVSVLWVFHRSTVNAMLAVLKGFRSQAAR